MDKNEHLYNAVVIGENPDAAFIVEGKHLHAVEEHVAKLEKEKSDPKRVLPLMRDALKALIKFSENKVEPHFLEVDWNGIAGKSHEQLDIIKCVHSIFSHLPHHERNDLSSLIHHKQTAK